MPRLSKSGSAAYALLLVLSLSAAKADTVSPAAGRPWTVEDSIGVRYFVNDPSENITPLWLQKPEEHDALAVPSPDGKHFFFVSFRGDLRTDSVVFQLDVYSVFDVVASLHAANRRPSAPLEPLRRLTLSAAGDGLANTEAAIASPRWEGNGHILFLRSERGTNRIYRYDISSGETTSLVPNEHDVALSVPATFATAGGSSVFMALDWQRDNVLDAYPAVTVADDRMQRLLDPRELLGGSFFASFHGGPARPTVPCKAGTFIFGPWISPDGRWAIVMCPLRGQVMPEHWATYERRPVHGYRFMLIDIEHATYRPMLDAPAGTVTMAGQGRAPPVEAFWSADSRHVVIFNAALPLSEDEASRRRMSYVIDYSVDSNQWTVLEPMMDAQRVKLQKLQWQEEGRTLLASRADSASKAAASLRFAYQDGRWRREQNSGAARSPAKSVFPAGFSVHLRQGVNEPPVMVASSGKRERVLTGADPALEGVWRAPAKVFEWQDGSRGKSRGLLMLPRNYAEGQRLPLVIQGFSFEPASFRPDGVTSSAFAAQALVAQGFAVLQIDFAYDDLDSTFQTPDEAPARVDRIDAVVGSLAAEGIVDPARVGLIGFSRSGYSTYYTVTHPGKVKLAAAIVFDSITTSFGEYVNDAAMGNAGTAIFEKQYGPGTFWRNKQAWLTHAPSFNLERLVTPVLFATTTPDIPGALETIGAFRLSGRPFDFLLFPRGSHQLGRPRERVAAMQATVDWMNFWLLGRPPQGADTERTARWQRMKADWEALQAREAGGDERATSLRAD